ncbi:MAG: hypothetical protein L6Q77_07565 [Bacteroidetes bacterium]|nr:hypothetical protein [Bacteroidota bacterium]
MVIKSLFLIGIALALSACGNSEEITQYKGTAQMPLTGRMALRQIRTIGILVPEFTVNELSAGGTQTFLRNETDSARKRLLHSFKNRLTQLGYQVSVLPAGKIDSLAFSEFIPLYLRTERLILDKQALKKQPKFEYDIGSLDTIPRFYQIDAVLVLSGYESIPSESRIATQATAAAVGVFIGSTIILENPAFLSAGIVYRNGKLVYYNFIKANNGLNLLNPQDIEKTTDFVLDRLETEL